MCESRHCASRWDVICNRVNECTDIDEVITMLKEKTEYEKL